ncbi:hypothetical protein DdX_22404 [Ditylenchus destructor]|uniref:Uncharacterized protein n=1 Tax=Ditylenchus destructor TaxID=166010 RepID=A0AAD4MDN9_9BILA|nr:hypothetical protein DdX_22404 [Ditylenchus destructor]
MCPMPVLIGTDTMQYFDDSGEVIFNFRNGEIGIGQNIRLPMISHIGVKTASEVTMPSTETLPPFADMFIMGNTDTRFPHHTECIVEPYAHRYENLLVGRTLVQPGSSQKVALQLFNSGPTALTVYAGSYLANIELLMTPHINEVDQHIPPEVRIEDDLPNIQIQQIFPNDWVKKLICRTLNSAQKHRRNFGA